MNCSCPKCNADIQIDRSRATETGTATTCPECNSRFWLLREPFVLRAYKKAGNLYCHSCNSPLGTSHMCENCGALYPSYCVVQAVKPVRRKAVKTADYFGRAKRSKKQTVVASHDSSVYASHESPATRRKSLPILLVVVVAVVALAAAIGSYVVKAKAEQQYARNYVLALYGVKSGADRSLNKFEKVSGEWKAMAESGQVYILRIAPQEKADLDTVKAEVDKVMQQLGAPPEKFSDAQDRLSRLYQIYSRLYALNLSPPDNLPAFSEATTRLARDFDRATQELKSTLPEELFEEIRQVAPRYKNLQPLVAN